MKQIFLIIILTCFYIQCFPQSKMTKKEILIELKKYDKMRNDRRLKEYGNRLKRLPFDNKVIEFIDSLRINQVDTIGVFYAKYIGAVSSDSCDSGDSPWESHVHWKKNNSIFHRTIRQFCNYKTFIINSSAIIDYYNNCSHELKNEKIIPVIVKAERDVNGEPEIISSLIDHTANYSIFCKRASDSILVNFSEYDMDEKENIFHNENNKTRIKSWFNMIENQINEIRNKLTPGHNSTYPQAGF